MKASPNLDQSANTFLDMQQQLQKQARSIFGNFPFGNLGAQAADSKPEAPASDTDSFKQPTQKLGSELLPGHTAPMAGSIAVRIQGSPDRLQLAGKVEYLLGRGDPKNEAAPDLDLGPYNGQQMGVSRRHATLLYNEFGLGIVDLGSTNGTLVNGRLLTAGKLQILKDGDEVKLGKLALNVYFGPENQ
ncbi:MAG: FHA domain-containing protein [Chloroflexota bacterium]